MDEKFKEAVSFLSEKMKNTLYTLPTELQKDCREVCIRSNRPLTAAGFHGNYFIKQTGGYENNPSENSYIVSKAEVDECMRTLTEYSIHSFKREINAGFLTVRGGHRAGISGTALCGSNQVLSVTDISSINLRIARQIYGVASELAHSVFANGVTSVLIAGSPASGKTTILKDLSRILSNSGKKISLIDERGEIAASYRGVPQNNVGILTDVFDGYQKGEGMAIAIRSMSPDVIILDELGGEQDAFSIRQSLNAGVAVVATVHASSFEELSRKQYLQLLLKEGAFSHIVLLEGAKAPGKIARIIDLKEMVPV